MKNMFVRFVREDAGQDLIEYGLLVGIITVGAIVSINAIGPKVARYFSDAQRRLLRVVSSDEGGVARPHPPSVDLIGAKCRGLPRRGQMRIGAQFARAVAARS